MPKLRPTIAERRRELWGALHAEIRNAGGFVTSVPDASPVRFECSIGSSLPDKLKQFGYPVQGVGTTEKFDATGHKVTVEIHSAGLLRGAITASASLASPAMVKRQGSGETPYCPVRIRSDKALTRCDRLAEL
jgi:hypothetical protein